MDDALKAAEATLTRFSGSGKLFSSKDALYRVSQALFLHHGYVKRFPFMPEVVFNREAG